MNTYLYTGALLLHDETSTRLRGMVGAFGPQNEEGVVRFTLDVRYMAWETDGESVTIDIPEQWARQLVEYLVKAIERLEHLRVLQQSGLLAPDALCETKGTNGLENAPLLKQVGYSSKGTNLKPTLYTGVQSLHDQNGDLLLGTVGAFGPSTEEGVVRVKLDLRNLASEIDGESVTIDMPEQWARRLSDNLVKVTEQLENLRALLKARLLLEDALCSLPGVESLENAPFLPC